MVVHVHVAVFQLVPHCGHNPLQSSEHSGANGTASTSCSRSSGASFPESGFTGGWHGTSHHGDKPENIANYSKVNRYHVQNLAYFCEKLSKIPDGDGTVLDHVLIYKGSNMGNSHRHAHEKVPVILVGGIDGTFKGNRHLAFPDNTQRTSNMLLSLMHLYGIEMDKIGTSTGRLQPLEMV